MAEAQVYQPKSSEQLPTFKSAQAIGPFWLRGPKEYGLGVLFGLARLSGSGVATSFASEALVRLIYINRCLALRAFVPSDGHGKLIAKIHSNDGGYRRGLADNEFKCKLRAAQTDVQLDDAKHLQWVFVGIANTRQGSREHLNYKPV